METQRLVLTKVNKNDAGFIFELLNSPGWINFIGNRNIETIDDALAYIQKITNNPATDYWTVKLKDQQTPIGVVTFIKREYLECHDIGYAFLPQFGKQGYAYEASKKLLDEMSSDHKKIMATVLKNNTSSIQLLGKLGMQFEKEIVVDDESLMLYSISTHNNKQP